MEETEDQPEHCWYESIAQTAHSGDHALNQALLVGIRMHGHKRADGRIRDAEIKDTSR